ncbi:MAG: hypothetical protein KJ558_11375 [Gammaproteobacteria bacterium]|nr:hypothetical protein [Gammaproteobacteria bacterium]MBU1655408.1 hypothetical protein [Gammaproteobacteria bacterium]MBU1960816.1 hypothetical protein [Gammaproteobacteria bacterium]
MGNAMLTEWELVTVDRDEKARELLANLKEHSSELMELLDSVSGRRYEDVVYRFYCGSYKIYGAQENTDAIVEALRKVAPKGIPLSPIFERIYQAGVSAKQIDAEITEQGKPILEAFLHARYFLEMAVKYGDELQDQPAYFPCGWAAVLCLYQIR